MARRLNTRALCDALAAILAGWLIAREVLTSLFAFHPPRLLLACAGLALVLMLWLRTPRSRVVGLALLGGGFLLSCIPPREEGEIAFFRRAVSYFFQFGAWLSQAGSSSELPLHPTYGATLWLLIAFAAALLSVLLLYVFRTPVTCAVLSCLLFAGLQLLPFPQDADARRLLLTLLAVFACCAWVYGGRLWERAHRAGSYTRWQRTLALVLLPALLLSTGAAMLGDRLNWRSARFSSQVDEAAEVVASLFTTPARGSGMGESLEEVALGGHRLESGLARFDFSLGANAGEAELLYLRVAVFDQYTGTGWKRTESDEAVALGEDGFFEALSGVERTREGQWVQFTLSNVRYTSTRVPVPLEAVTMAAADLDDVALVRRQAGDASLSLRYRAIGGQGRLYAAVAQEDGESVYELPAVPLSASLYGEVTAATPLRRLTVVGHLIEGERESFPDGTVMPWPDTLDAAMRMPSYARIAQVSDESVRRALQLPASLPNTVRALALRVGTSVPYSTAVALREYLRTAHSYSLTPETPTGDFVAGFLFDTREGYCTSFASAMTVLARCCGIPARYVQGYLVPVEEARDGTYTVTDIDQHAWSELYFPGVGWMPFDATSFSQASRTPITLNSLDMLPFEDLTEQPEEEEPEEEEPDEEDEEEEDPEDEQPEDGEDGDGGAGSGGFRLPTPVRWLLALAALAAAGWGYLRLRMWQRARTHARYRKNGDLLAAYWELCRCAGALGCVHAPTQTVADYFAALQPMGLAENSARACARAVEAVNAAAYGGHSPTREERIALCELLEGAYRRLEALRSRWWIALWWRRGRS